VKKYQVISMLAVQAYYSVKPPSCLLIVDAVDVKDALDAAWQHYSREMSDDVYTAVAVICDGKLVWDGRQG
jgi:hypothetical protein